MNMNISPTQPTDRINWHGSDVLRVLAAGLVLYVLAMALWIFMVHVIFPDFATHTTLAFVDALVNSTLNPLAGIVVVYLLGLRRRKATWANLGLRPLAWRWAVGAIALGLVVLVIVTMVQPLIESLFGIGGVYSVFQPGPGLENLLFLPLLGVLGPVSEELLYRGVLYSWLRQRRGVVISVLVSSALGGLMRMAPVQIVPAVLIGIVSAVAYERSGSLWSSILIHITFASGWLLLAIR